MNQDDLTNEIRAIDKLCAGKHPNLVHVQRHNWLKDSPYYAIDMEFCDLTLEEYIRGDRELVCKKSAIYSLKDNEAAVKWLEISKIMQDITKGLSFIHGCEEVHRDLKPKNSMLCTVEADWRSSLFQGIRCLENCGFRFHSRGLFKYCSQHIWTWNVGLSCT